jgi:hypothetical protein
MTGVVLTLAGLTCGDGGPGMGAASDAVAFGGRLSEDFLPGEWKGEGWTGAGGPWSLSLSDGALCGHRTTPLAPGRVESEIFLLRELIATGGELRFSPYSSPPTSAKMTLTYRVEGRRLIVRGSGCLFVLHPAAPRKP